MTQRISLGDKAPNFNLENSTPAQPVHGARPKNRLATPKTASLCESQPLETKPDEGQANVSTASAEQTSVNCTDKNNLQNTHVAVVSANGKMDKAMSHEAAVFVPAALRTTKNNQNKPLNDEASFYALK